MDPKVCFTFVLLSLLVIQTLSASISKISSDDDDGNNELSVDLGDHQVLKTTTGASVAHEDEETISAPKKDKLKDKKGKDRSGSEIDAEQTQGKGQKFVSRKSKTSGITVKQVDGQNQTFKTSSSKTRKGASAGKQKQKQSQSVVLDDK